MAMTINVYWSLFPKHGFSMNYDIVHTKMKAQTGDPETRSENEQKIQLNHPIGR